MHRRLILLAGAAALLAGPAFADPQYTQQSGGTSSAPTPGPNDAAGRAEVVNTEEFLRLAAMSDRFEIASSRIVGERSQNQRIKEYALHMIRDHEKTTQERLKIAQVIPGAGAGAATPLPNGREAQGNTQSAPTTNAQGGPQPEGMDQQHAQMLQQLHQTQGAELDRLYMQMQVASHQKAVDMFQNYSQHGDTPQLKRFAAERLPVLQEHLQMAQRLQREVQS